MDIDNRMLLDLAKQLGIQGNQKGGGQSPQEDLAKAGQRASTYLDKSDAELMGEILELKKAMKTDRSAYEKQLKAVKALRPMMDEKQRARLDKIIGLLME